MLHKQKMFTYSFHVVIGSDNDNPNILPNDQLFMILEMEDGGNDLENFVFNSAHQAVFAFLQVCSHYI